MKKILDGDKVYLSAINLEKDCVSFSEWTQNSEYLRLMDSDPATRYSSKDMKDWHEKRVPEEYFFSIHKVSDNQLVGMIEIGSIDWVSGDAWIGMGIGQPENWGKGFGTEALQLLTRYAFTILNLSRLSLSVFEYNPRAIRSYEKAGFVYEGRQPQSVRRDNQWWDLLFMGLLRSKWKDMV